MTRYTFAVTLEAPAPVNDDDVDGYTAADVTALLARTLAYYLAPLHKAGRWVSVDYELLDVEPLDVEPTRTTLTREERLQGLADRGIDTWDDYYETK